MPPGTQVGAWRVYELRGCGAYGAVYRAGSVLPGPARTVALKLALLPHDARFEREAELLSRIRSPAVPRLVDSGVWRSPRGQVHPFVAMEWVEGEPLYVWAARRNPTSRQVLAVLAQAARALQATHEVSGVHRDVKGDNMLVRPGDERLFLTDLGAGYVAGAARLTPWNAVPGTREYHSAQLWEHPRKEDRSAAAAVLARPCDDVFALGVTAYRLVTDTYPPWALAGTELGLGGHPEGKKVLAPRQLNARVDAQLNALILRMLSVRPEERGTAGELAEAMERGAAHGGASAEERLFEWETEPPERWTEEERAQAEYLGHRPRRRDRRFVQWMEEADAAARAQRGTQGRGGARPRAGRAWSRRWLPWLAAVMALGLWPEETDSVRIVERPTVEHAAANKAMQKEEAVSLGDAAQSSSDAVAKLSSGGAITVEVPTQPFPGQMKPDAKGRCLKKLIPINGGCWAKVDVDVEQCHGPIFFVHQGGCYVPAYEPGRQPTSAPGQQEP
ncbi:MAG TPA: serine/threonine-protein kinase [Myxococcaceae bacterium]